MRTAIGLFAATLTAASLSAWGAAGPAVDVGFSPCDGMICMPVTLSDGEIHSLLLDTGNVNSWLSVKTARAFGNRLEPVMSGDKAIPGVYRIGTQTVAVGGEALSARFLALDEAATGTLPVSVEGALSYTAFKDRIVEIDYAGHRLHLGYAAPAQRSAPHAALKLMTFGSHGPPIVTIDGLSIDGRAFTAQYDTCFTGTVVVYDDAIERLGLRGAATRGSPRYFPYTDGGVVMNAATSGRIALGTAVLTDGAATIYFPAAGKNPVHQPDGLFEATVGNALFARSIVTLDFHSMTVSVRPSSRPPG